MLLEGERGGRTNGKEGQVLFLSYGRLTRVWGRWAELRSTPRGVEHKRASLAQRLTAQRVRHLKWLEFLCERR